jgi:hypothetical protein
MGGTWFNLATARRQSARAAVITVFLGLLIGAPGGAAAQPAGEPPLSAAFSLRGTNGFRLDVESRGGAVTIVASERRPPIATFAGNGAPRPAVAGNGAASIYRLRVSGRDPRRIEAALGRVGTISVSFQPSGRSRVTRWRPGRGACGHPTRLVRRLGTFVGTVEFHGEGGFTSVEATRARGSVGTPLPSDCGAGSGPPARLAFPLADRPSGVVLSAVNRRSGTRFEARTTALGSAFQATWRERLEGGIVVTRQAYAAASRSAFTYADDLGSARVAPPAPFAGSARYRAAGTAGRWTGNLTATFPGAATAMTGRGFRAQLRGRR